MRTLPAALTNEIAKEIHSIGHLIKIVLYNTATQQDVPLYFADKDMNVVCDLGDGSGAHTFLSRGVEFDGGTQSLTPKVDNVSFSIDNTALEFSSYVMNYETRGRDCVIYRAAFDPYLQVIGAAILFQGILDRVEVDHERSRFDVANSFIRWNQPTPRRKHAAKCFWVYKDTGTCRYTGSEPPCDKSWDECAARLNTRNYGGHRWAEDLENRDIQWGRS